MSATVNEISGNNVVVGEEVGRLYRITKTLMKMLNHRGYSVNDDEINMTKEQFLDKYGQNIIKEDLTILKANRNDSSNQIYVFFPHERKVGVELIKTYVQRMKSDNVSRCILVVGQKLTPMAEKGLTKMSSRFRFEVFLELELLINIIDHVLVPEHKPLTDKEKETLLKRYTLKATQLPRIRKRDPVAKYYGLIEGQVVKITRTSETAVRYTTYRYVF